MVTLYLNGNPPWLKVFGDDQKPRVVLVTVLTSLILLLYDGLMVSDIHLQNIFSPNPDFLLCVHLNFRPRLVHMCTLTLSKVPYT